MNAKNSVRIRVITCVRAVDGVVCYWKACRTYGNTWTEDRKDAGVFATTPALSYALVNADYTGFKPETADFDDAWPCP